MRLDYLPKLRVPDMLGDICGRMKSMTKLKCFEISVGCMPKCISLIWMEI